MNSLSLVFLLKLPVLKELSQRLRRWFIWKTAYQARLRSLVQTPALPRMKMQTSARSWYSGPKVAGPGAEDHPQQHSELQSSQGRVGPCLKVETPVNWLNNWRKIYVLLDCNCHRWNSKQFKALICFMTPINLPSDDYPFKISLLCK